MAPKLPWLCDCGTCVLITTLPQLSLNPLIQPLAH